MSQCTDTQGSFGNRLFTVKQLARELNCSVRTAWRLIGLGKVKVVRIGRGTRVTRESVDQFIASGGER